MQPLKWPEGQKRTRIKERSKRGVWKLTLAKYTVELMDELKRLKARWDPLESTCRHASLSIL